MKNIVLILILFATLAVPGWVSGQAVVLKIDTVSVNCASIDTILVPVRVRNFTNVGSFQFTISWDTTKIRFINTTALNVLLQGAGVNSGIDVGSFINQNPAKITFNWTKVGGGSVPNNTQVFAMRFKRVGGPFAAVQMVNTPVAVEVTDALGNDLPFTTIPGGVRPIDDTKPTINCPADVTTMASLPSAINNIAPSNVGDNCAISTVGWASLGATNTSMPTDPDASGAVFNFGISTVTYTASDVGGNTATCSFKINLQPSSTSDTLTIFAQNASVSCGQNVGINISALNFDALGSLQFSIKYDTAIVKYVNITGFNPALNLNLQNNFGIFQNTGTITFTWTTGQLAGTTLPPGANLFTLNFMAKGSSNAISPLEFIDIPAVREAFESANGFPNEIPAIWINGSITIQDLTAPTLTCPPTTLVDAPNGTTAIQVNNLQPLTLSDNCSGLVGLAYTRTGLTQGNGTGNANGVYNAGTTIVTYTATDLAGNTSTCSFLVVVDAGTPVTITLDSLTNDCTGAGTQVKSCITVEDFDDIVGLQFNVNWNPAVLQFNAVTNQYPGLNLNIPGDFNNFATTSSGLLKFLSGNLSGWPNIPAGEPLFCILFTVLNSNGTSPINFSGPFEAANSTLDVVPVNPVNGYFESVDQSAPQIICPANITTTAPLGTCIATVNIPSPQTSDACSGIQGLVRTPLSDVFPAGNTVVTYTVTDNVGLTAVCSLTVTVNANSTPVMTVCPANITLNAPGTTCSAIVNWQAPTAVDACGITPITPVPNKAPNTSFPVGNTTVSYTATDAQGNSTSCTFIVTIRDIQKPVIICPGSYVLPIDSTQCCAPGGFQVPSATDNCDNNPSVSGTHLPDEPFCVGTTQVTFTATDDFNNTASCTFTITVSDQTPPKVISCPSDIVVSTSPNNCGATVNWAIPTFEDVCDGTQLTIINVYNPNTLFAIGETVVEYYASDSSFNLALCSFKVKVNDLTAPTISGCPGNITVQVSDSKCDTILSWPSPLAFDNCPNITLTSLPAQNTPFPVGNSTVTYTAKDASGNTSTCTFSVQVSEKKPPVFTNCPPDFLLTNVDPCNAVPPWTAFPSAIDNCSGVVIDSSTYRPGDAFPVGETIVVILATDGSGNLDTCAFKVTIIGTPPGFNKIPEDINKVGCAQEIIWEEPVVVGICNLDTIVSNYNPGDTFLPGTTVVVYTATDLNGMTVTATFSVNIVDDIPPVILCPSGPIVVNIGGTKLSDPSGFIFSTDTVSACDGIELVFILPTATDNCSDVQLEQTEGGITGTKFPIGVQTLQFIAVDGIGNTAVCSVELDVQPIAALNPVSTPNPICSPGTVVVTLTDIQDATYIWQGANRNDTLSVNEYNVVIGKENNTYTVFAVVKGCKSSIETVQLQLVNRPEAVNDTFFVQPGASDTLYLLKNDGLSPGDGGVITYQPNPLEGIKEISNGVFVVDPTSGTKSITFFYKLCSSICDSFCDNVNATVYVIQKDEDCSFIPNTFTPNGDNIHDLLVIPCITLLEKPCPLVVYNQWGDKVYETDKYDNTWDGTYLGKGKPLPDGAYFYIFQPSNVGGSTRKGFIQIIR